MANNKDKLIFGNGYSVGIGYHNVGDVLRSATPEVIQAVAKQYGQRCGHTPPGQETGVIVHEATTDVTEQMAYLSEITGSQINIFTPQDPLPDNSLVAPYINTGNTHKLLEAKGAKVWGFYPELTEKLKNKADFHTLVSELNIEGVTIPEYQICDIDDQRAAMARMLRQSLQMYSAAGMANFYPLGAMIRGAESDGNYGGCSVRRQPQSSQVLFVNDEGQYPCPNWTTAINLANEYIRQATDAAKERRVVVSRLLDISDSPGISLIFQNGEMDHFGWNGQVTPPGGTACVGTSSYRPRSPQLAQIQKDREDNSIESLGNFVLALSERLGIARSRLNGLVNFDLMIPGPAETELQRRLGKKAQITVAESNPRWTNWTDALALVVRAEGFRMSVAGFNQARRRQVLTVDKLDIGPNGHITKKQLRDTVQELDHQLRGEDGSRVILRMATLPKPGLILAGDTVRAQKQVTHALAGL